MYNYTINVVIIERGGGQVTCSSSAIVVTNVVITLARILALPMLFLSLSFLLLYLLTYNLLTLYENNLAFFFFFLFFFFFFLQHYSPIWIHNLYKHTFFRRSLQSNMAGFQSIKHHCFVFARIRTISPTKWDKRYTSRIICT